MVRHFTSHIPPREACEQRHERNEPDGFPIVRTVTRRIPTERQNAEQYEANWMQHPIKDHTEKKLEGSPGSGFSEITKWHPFSLRGFVQGYAADFVLHSTLDPEAELEVCCPNDGV